MVDFAQMIKPKNEPNFSKFMNQSSSSKLYTPTEVTEQAQ